MSIDLGEQLNPKTQEGKAILKDLQSNILKGHARNHAMHLFVCFGASSNVNEHDGNLPKVRQWLEHLANKHVTSALHQSEDEKKETVLANVLLSSQGYEFLGERRPRDSAFREGMRERRDRLNDPVFQKWAPEYKQKAEDIHALVIVGSSEKDGAEAKVELDGLRDEMKRQLEFFGGSILIDERGSQKRDAKGRAVEHFGYADGVSQPQFIAAGQPEKEKYDQAAPLKLVLEKDRHGDGGFGSYFVYRKLEQNVTSFNEAVERVGGQLGVSEELAGAMALGRFKNGTPLTTHGTPKPGYDPKKDEDFDYDEDDEGSKCPMHAHIRKVNPRGELGFFTNILAREQRRRIARRGITYTNDSPRSVGLIFMCFQNDISDQFEFIQRRWANDHSFKKRGVGLDPVIGQDGGPQEPNDLPNWPTGYDKEGRERIRFDEHVRFLGGEYFFAPSIAGLKNLSR